MISNCLKNLSFLERLFKHRWYSSLQWFNLSNSLVTHKIIIVAFLLIKNFIRLSPQIFERDSIYWKNLSIYPNTHHIFIIITKHWGSYYVCTPKNNFTLSRYLGRMRHLCDSMKPLKYIILIHLKILHKSQSLKFYLEDCHKSAKRFWNEIVLVFRRKFKNS